jgi:hypothetical protein
MEFKPVALMLHRTGHAEDPEYIACGAVVLLAFVMSDDTSLRFVRDVEQLQQLRAAFAAPATKKPLRDGDRRIPTPPTLYRRITT